MQQLHHCSIDFDLMASLPIDQLPNSYHTAV